MADIFLSYASPDRERARILAEALMRNGHDVWWDRTIPPGRVFDEVIQEALQSARCIVVLWSEQSVRSNWVKTEAAEGVTQGKLVPALIEPVAPPIEFKRIQAADLSGWAGEENADEYRKLLAAINDRLAHPGTPLKEGRGAERDRRDAPLPPSPKSSGMPILTIMSTLAVIGIAATVAIKWLPREAGRTSSAPPSSASGQVPATVSSAQQSDLAKPSGTTPSPPASDTTSSSAPARTPSPIGRTNLLAAENGGELVTASNERWSMTIDGKDDTYAWVDTGEGVFGFKDGRAATFDAFAVLIPNSSDSNLREFELLAGNDLNGKFQSIGTFTTQNLRIMKNPYQEFKFPPVKARYLKLRSLKSHAGTPGATTGYEFRLYGTLN